MTGQHYLIQEDDLGITDHSLHTERCNRSKKANQEKSLQAHIGSAELALLPTGQRSPEKKVVHKKYAEIHKLGERNPINRANKR